MFQQHAARVLRRAGVRPLPAGGVLVLLFDSSRWQPWTDGTLALLSPAEQERSRRFRLAQHRDIFLLAHAMWRLALACVLDCTVQDVTLAFALHGQPQLPGTPYATSLSHSGTHVAIGIGHTAILGVDIEQSPPRAPLRELAGEICTPDEAATINALAYEQREPALLALWTRKEALLKAFGVGLRSAPSMTSAPAGPLIDPPAPASALPPCRVHPLQLQHGLLGALAAPANVEGFAQYWLDPSPASPTQ